MNNLKKMHDLLADLSWILDRETYQRFLWDYERLSKMNEAERVNERAVQQSILSKKV